MTPNHLLTAILADIQTAELWWTEIAKKHGVPFPLVQTIGWAPQPYAVILCGQCNGTGKHEEAACKRCGGRGTSS